MSQRSEIGDASSPTAASMNGLDISVVIPCYNARSTLGPLLDGLLQQSLPRDSYEVIVVDDGSTDGSPDVVRQRQGVILLQQNQRGPGAARNLGTQSSRGRYVLYLDADLAVAPNLLEEHLRFFERDSTLAATGGSVLPIRPPSLFSWLLADHLCSWFNAHPKVNYASPPEYLPSLNFCVERRRVIDEAQRSWEAGLEHTGEDVLYCHALGERKLKLGFVPTAIVYHQDRATMAGYLRHQYRWGEHAPYVRGRLRDLKFSFLFPSSPWMQLFWLPAIVGGYSLLIWKAWLPARPVQATLSIPHILLGRLAYAAGVTRGSFRLARERARQRNRPRHA